MNRLTNIYNIIRYGRWARLLLLAAFFLLPSSFFYLHAQIVIGGNVYGGARQANVGGSTFVHIGADHHDVLIKAVYGGNDISGTIGTSNEVPADLDPDKIKPEAEGGYGIDNTYNTFVRISPENVVNGKQRNLFIGSLFGGAIILIPHRRRTKSMILPCPMRKSPVWMMTTIPFGVMLYSPILTSQRQIKPIWKSWAVPLLLSMVVVIMLR